MEDKANLDWHHSPQLEDIFAEQEEKLPHGPLGVLGNQSIELMEGLPSEAVSLMQDYLSGQFGTIEFANRAEAIKQRSASSHLPRPET